MNYIVPAVQLERLKEVTELFFILIKKLLVSKSTLFYSLCLA